MACCRQRAAELPVESLVNVSSLIERLSAIAATGIKNFVFEDVALERLAMSLANLVIENNYLKKLTVLFDIPNITNDENTVKIAFGPGNAYTLNIALISPEQRTEMAEQLRTVADKLHAPNTAKQLNLFEK